MKYVWLLLLHYFHEISSIKSLFNKRQSRNSCFDLRTTADSNSGVKKVAKIVRFFAIHIFCQIASIAGDCRSSRHIGTKFF